MTPWIKTRSAAIQASPGKIDDRIVPEGQRAEVLGKLFPQHRDVPRDQHELLHEMVYASTVISTEEFRGAAERIKVGNAPGPDSPPSALRTLLQELPGVAAAIAITIVRNGQLPMTRKETEVVFMPKGNGGYWPICLISALAKAYEAV